MFIRPGVYPQVVCRGILGIVLFYLGYPDQALAHNNAAVAEALRVTHPPSLSMSLTNICRLLWLVGDITALKERADKVIAVATEQGFPFWGALGTFYREWSKMKTGDAVGGAALLRITVANYRATGAELGVPFMLALIAEAYDIAGQNGEGLTLLDEALQIVETTGERWFAAELNRRKGQLLLRQGYSEVAEDLYRNALSIAQGQEAKLWELRAAVSLARLRSDQGRRTEALNLLAPVYAWFTEGFDTPDLKEAKALLDELG